MAIGNTRNSKKGRWSDSKLPPGIDRMPGGIPRILSQPPSTPHGIPLVNDPEPEVFIITEEIPAAAITYPYAYQIQAFSTAGGILEYAVAIGGLPEGLELDSTGLISGTSVNVEAQTFTLKVFIQGSSPEIAAFKDFTLVSGAAPTSLDPLAILSTTPLPESIQNFPYSYQFIGFSGSGPLVWTANDPLPEGGTLSEDGLLSGPFSELGDFTFEIELNDGVNPAVMADFTLTVLPQLQGLIVITVNSPITHGVVNEIYGFQFTAIGNTIPIEWSITGEPDGLILNTSTGFLSGVPTESGTFALEVTASNMVDVPATKDFTLVVHPNLPTVTVDTPDNFTAGEDVLIEWTIDDPLTFTPEWQLFVVLDNQPFGPFPMTPVDNGGGSWETTITTPYSLAAGDYQVAVLETVSLAIGFSEEFTVTAYPTPVFTTPNPLPDGEVGVAYSQSVVATGGLDTLVYSATGLPGTLSMSSAGLITGTPLVAASYPLIVEVTDGIGPTITANYTLNVLDAGFIVITTTSPLPSGFENVAYSKQFTQEGGGAGTWSITSGSVPGLSMDAAGLLSGTPTTAGLYTIEVTYSDGVLADAVQDFDIEIEPELGKGFFDWTLRDGFVVRVFEGDSFTITNGYVNVFGQTLDLASHVDGSGNAPGGCPTGIKVRFEFGDFEILNTGFPAGLSTSIGPTIGQPVYFQSLVCYMPGRLPMFAEEYQGAIDLGSDTWELIRPTDPKHPGPSVVMGQNKYIPSQTTNMVDGGEAIHYRLVPLSDPHEVLPGAGAFADAITIANIDETRVAAWPLLEHLLDLYHHEPDDYDDPNLPHNETRMTWMTKIDNIGANIGGGGPQSGVNMNPSPYKRWYGGLFTMTPGSLSADAGNSLSPCWYFSDAYYGIYVTRHQTDLPTYEYFLGLLRKKISSGMFRTDSSSFAKNMWRDEASSGQLYQGVGQIRKVGAGAVFAPNYAKTWDLGLVLGYIMTEGNDPLIADAFDRRTARLTGTYESPVVGGSLAHLQGAGQRSSAHYLHSLEWFYKAHTILGNAATAANLKTKAGNYIESLFVLRDQAGASTIGGGTKPNWWPSTNNPTVTPITTTATSGGGTLPATGGYGEGLLTVIAHWIVDHGTNAGRLTDFQDCCEWQLEFRTRSIGTGTGGSGPRYEWAYRHYIPQPTSGTTWNNAPPVYSGDPDPSYNGFVHGVWELGLEPYMTSWFPGNVAPGGITWATFFERLARMAYEDPNTRYPGFSTDNCGAFKSGNNGSLTSDVWAQKNSGIFCFGAFA